MGSKKFNLILGSLLLILLMSLAIGSVSANGDTFDSISSSDSIAISELDDNTVSGDSLNLADTNKIADTGLLNDNYLSNSADTAVLNSADVDTVDSEDKELTEAYEKNQTVSSSNPLTTTQKVTESTYSTYFNSKGTVINSKVSSGDTLDFSGSFTNKNFTINIPLTITSSSGASLINCSFKFISGSSGSVISKLYINSSTVDTPVIYLSDVTNMIIKNNTVISSGKSSYPIYLDNTNYTNVLNNDVKSIKVDESNLVSCPSSIVLSGTYYNNISNNIVRAGDNNGIYITTFVGTKGGDYNYISNNTIFSNRTLPSSFCYGVQLMGNSNTAVNNTIYNMYIGVSSAGTNNTMIGNAIYNIHGAYLSATTTEEGGEAGIVGKDDNIIKNNTIYNSNFNNASGAAIIVAGSNIVVENNIIKNNSGFGIKYEGDGNDVLINNNAVEVSNNGIYIQGNVGEMNITNNIVNSTGGIGMDFVKYSSSKYPHDIILMNNTVIVNETAIDARGVLDLSIAIINNEVYDKAVLLASSGNNTIYNIIEDTFYNYFDSSGNLLSFVNDGDTLRFVGDFTSKGKLSISSKVTITGLSARFVDTTFVIQESGVAIENLFINNSNSSIEHNWGIKVEDANKLTIDSNEIHVYDKDSAYAIYLLNVSNSTISNNILQSKGDNISSPFLAYNSSNNKITNNTISAIGTGEAYLTDFSSSDIYRDGFMDACYKNNSYLDGSLNLCIDGYMDGTTEGTHNVAGIFKTYGALMLYSNKNQFLNNNITVTSNLAGLTPYSLSDNAIAGVYAYYSCSNNNISNNYVHVYGNDPFAYGMGVIGSDQISTGNNLSNNTIVLNDGNYAAKAILIGLNASNNNVFNNQISVNGESYAYGIVAYEALSNNIYDNNITVESNNFAYGLATYHSNGTEVFRNEENAAYAEIDFKDTSITLNDAYSFFVKKSYILTVDINSEDSSTVGVGSVYLYVNGTFVGSVSVSGGIANLPIFIDTVGDYDLTLKYVGDVGYLSSDAQSKLIIFEPVINVTHTGDDVGDIQKAIDDAEDGYTINLGDDYTYSNLANINVTKNLTIKSGLNTSLMGAEDADVVFNIIPKSHNGSANVTFANLVFYANEDNIFVLAIAEDNGYTSDIAEININNVTIKQANDDVAIESITVLKVLTDSKVFNPSNSITVVGNTLVSGIKTFVLESTYWINGSDIVIPKADRIKTVLNVETVETGLANVIATLKDLNNNLLANQIVNYTINNVTATITTDENGQIAISNLTNDSLIYFDYDGNEIYESSSSFVNFTLLKQKATIINCKNMTTSAIYIDRTGEYFVANLTDSDGKALVNKTVQIGFNGATYSRTTDENGSFRLQVNLKVAGGYTFAIAFLGDKYYNSSFAVAKITVNKAKTVLTNAKSKYTYKASATKTLKASLKLSNGTVVSGKTLKFTVNGKTYSATTNTKGVATVKVSITAKKTYKYTVKFAATSQLSASKTTGTLIVS